MRRFNSDAIKQADYDPATQRLTIWFPKGKPYTYCRVPPRVWEELQRAPSAGRYFNDHIDGKYQC
jgi:hypothetical protein